jgi:tetratricopeptide (TPR) repeat protein
MRFHLVHDGFEFAHGHRAFLASLQQAGQHFQEALQISRQLAEEEPAIRLPDVAMSLNDMGTLDLNQKRFEDARRHYEESLKLYRDLALRDPKTFLPFLAGTMDNLAFLERSLHQIEPARAHYEEALAIYQQLSRSDPRRFSPRIRQVELSLAELNAQSAAK